MRDHDTPTRTTEPILPSDGWIPEWRVLLHVAARLYLKDPATPIFEGQTFSPFVVGFIGAAEAYLMAESAP